jgi:hypothetical protein
MQPGTIGIIIFLTVVCVFIFAPKREIPGASYRERPGPSFYDAPSRSVPLRNVCAMGSIGYKQISNALDSIQDAGHGLHKRTCIGITKGLQVSCGKCDKDTMYSDFVPSDMCEQFKHGIEEIISGECNHLIT